MANEVPLVAHPIVYQDFETKPHHPIMIPTKRTHTPHTEYNKKIFSHMSHRLNGIFQFTASLNFIDKDLPVHFAVENL